MGSFHEGLELGGGKEIGNTKDSFFVVSFKLGGRQHCTTRSLLDQTARSNN